VRLLDGRLRLLSGAAGPVFALNNGDAAQQELDGQVKEADLCADLGQGLLVNVADVLPTADGGP
jgi:hypothetical protein